jgi:D-alanine-D-alanine ligase-like ATP-grasp enzyme
MRDVVRFDVRMTPAHEFVFLEANARPSLERGADTATAASLDGMSYEELLAELIGARLARRGGRR